MYHIAVCDESEYGKRLMKYLESHIGPSYRIHCFSERESFLSWKEEADLYIMEEGFLERTDLFKDKRLITLSNDIKEGGFCKFRAPRELIEIIEDSFRQTMTIEIPKVRAEAEIPAKEEVAPPVQKSFDAEIIGIFMPVHINSIDEILKKYKRERTLVISMEDLNYMDYGHPNASDLCYYIHIREEDIFQRITGIVFHYDEIDWIRSPDIFFDLGELKTEDFLWLFERIEVQEEYDSVIFCLGFSALREAGLLSCFKKLILIDIEGFAALSHLTRQMKEMLSKDTDISGERIEVITINNT